MLIYYQQTLAAAARADMHFSMTARQTSGRSSTKRTTLRPCTPSQTSDDQSHFSTYPIAWAREVLDFIPDDKQQQVLAAIDTNGILNCTRQWGKSTTCAIKAVHHAHFHPDSLIIVASPSLRQSGEFIRKARKAVSKLGIRPRGDGENRCSILLPNGARSSASPKAKTPSAASPASDS